MILAGDVGGTKVHLALYDFTNGKLKYTREERFPAKDYSGLEAIVKEFLGADQATRPALACPARCAHGRLRLTNLPWTLDSRELAVALAHPARLPDQRPRGQRLRHRRTDLRPDLHPERRRSRPDRQSRPDRRRHRPGRGPPDLERPHARSLSLRRRPCRLLRRATKTRSTCCAFSSRSTTAASAGSAWSAAWA